MAYLSISQHEQEISRRPLKRTVVVGRSDQADIQIHDRLLSRRHCRIEPVDDGWMVVDLNSHNGTYVNGVRVHRHRLGDDERVQVGDTVLTFHAGEFVSYRPADPREAVLRARLENEVDNASGDTMGLHGRTLPTPRLTRSGRPRKQRSSPNDAPAAILRPRPTPQIVGMARPPEQPSSPPSLFTRLLGRRQP